MSCLISLKNINFKYNLESILENIDFSINQGEKVAIVGHNGSGKSTLLHILSGKIESYQGSKSVKNGLRSEIVEQYLDEKLKEFTLLDALMEKFSDEEKSYLQYEAEILLEDLYFEHKDYNIKVKDLSGGGQNRLLFARAIIKKPDLVFMDEPTNHLDLKSLLYIEDYIKNKAKFSAVIISHDKRFLGNVSNKTIILRDKSSYTFNLNYENALLELAIADENAKKRLELEEKEIARIKKSAKRLAIWGREHDNEDLAKKAKSMIKRAERLEDDKTFVTRGNPYELNLVFESISSKFAIQMSDSVIHYGEKLLSDKSNKLFELSNLNIKSGEKVALLGANGKGKSTLINTIVNKLNNNVFDHSFRSAPNLDYGLFDQEQLVLNPVKSIHSEVVRLTGEDDNTVKNTLIKTGFKYDRHSVLVNTLSGGEKSRIIFSVLYLKKPNFIILDEPTNHIDLDGKTELANSLKESNITALITGHDRAFIEEVADRYILIDKGKLVEIDRPEDFYETLLNDKFESVEQEVFQSHSMTQAQEISLKDDILTRILVLEEKLAEDIKRKPKFQKESLQIEWKNEIDELYRKLES